MTKYTINDKVYLTICSIHDEINEIFNRIKKINPNMTESPDELFNIILKEIKFGFELTEVAKEMGQKMEDGLRQNNGWGPTGHYINYQNPYYENDNEE